MANCSKFLMIFLFFPVLCVAQSISKSSCADQFREEVYLHLSRNIIAVGETLYFKAYIFDKISDNKSKSRILYIRLYDNNNELKGSFKSNISDNTCESSFVIPDTLATGQYSIIAYTNLMRNFPASTLIRYDILVAGVSETQQDLNSSGLSNSEVDSASAAALLQLPENSMLQIALNKDQFSPKENIILDLTNNSPRDFRNNISVSVSEVLPGQLSALNPDITAFYYAVFAKEFSNTKYPNLNEAVNGFSKTNNIDYWKYKCEYSGFRVEGTVFNRATQQPAAGKEILLSVPDSFANMKYCISDSAGYFRFVLDTSYDNKKLIINVNNDNEINEYYFTFDNKQIAFENSFSKKIDLNSLTDYFLKCRKIALINKIFNQPLVRLPENKPINKANFYGLPTYVTKLSDFIDLNDFTDISKNVLPGVRFKKKKDKYKITLRSLSQNSQSYPENCLVLMNNIPFYDYSYLATLGSAQIDHIDVNSEHIAYGNIDFYGILSVFTKDRIVIPNKGAAIIDNNFENNCGVVANIVSPGSRQKLPLFKQLLYWNPEVTFDNSGKAQLVFNSSDLTSDYIIDIEGLLDGKPYSKKLLIKVK